MCHVYSVWNVPVQKKKRSLCNSTQKPNGSWWEKKNRWLEVCSQTWSSNDEYFGLTFGCQILFCAHHPQCWGRIKKKDPKYDNDCCNLSRRLSGGREEKWHVEPIIHFRIVMFIFYLFGSSAFLSFCLRHRKAVGKSASHHQSDCSISDGLLRQRARKQEAPRARWW